MCFGGNPSDNAARCSGHPLGQPICGGASREVSEVDRRPAGVLAPAAVACSCRLAQDGSREDAPVSRDAVKDLNHTLRDLDSRLQRFAEKLRSEEASVDSDSFDAEQLGEVRRAFNKILRSFEQST